MELNKIEKEGVTYFEIYIPCPDCHGRGISTKEMFAIHEDCGGKMYAGDNGHYRCELCNLEAPVYYWEFECNCISQSEFFLFKKNEQSKSDSITMHIALAGQLVTITGIPWLQNFLQNSDSENY